MRRVETGTVWVGEGNCGCDRYEEWVREGEQARHDWECTGVVRVFEPGCIAEICHA